MRLSLAGLFMLVALPGISVVEIPQAAADVCTVYPDGKPNLSCDSPGLPACFFNPSRSEWACIPRNTVACSSQYASWYCDAGKSCYGDGRDMAHACY